MEKKIPYISRNYDDYRQALIDLSKKYYPELDFNFDDASVGSWFLDLNAVIADELSYHVDRAYQETNINSAMKASSLFTLARNMGFKVPGPKGAMCEVAFKCIIPPKKDDNGKALFPDFDNYAPIIKKGTKVSSGSQTFELLDELVFAHQFNYDGVSDRLIQPIRNSNSEIISYQVTKFAVVIAGESNIYKKYISSDDVVPFMEILLPAENVMNIESIIVKEGSSFQDNPTIAEFYMPEETASTTTTVRFFEVDSLSQQERWDAVYVDGKPDVYEYTSDTAETPSYSITKGVWKNIKHKFVTEYTDNGYLKITFGAGLESEPDVTGASSFAEYQITKMMRNNSLGFLPKPDTTVFIRYRSGGGKASNLPKGAINTISYLNAEILGGASEVQKGRVLASISVESTMASVSGKDMPTADELKNMMKYYTGAQQRCVTLKDYESRVMQMPAKYGCPFRVGALEQNNKVMLYLLGVNSEGQLDKSLPLAMVENIQKYLSKYRMVNDFVEIKPGKIINLHFNIRVIIDKNYNACDVITSIRNTIENYMDIRKHDMGEDIFVGDIAKEISKVDGVINLVKLRVYNKYDTGTNNDSYSTDRTEQDLVTGCDVVNGYGLDEIDLDASDMMLYSVGNMCMFELKRPENDIEIEYKQK